jgi:YegS/Rv2252/BmrU family lipid kinase
MKRKLIFNPAAGKGKAALVWPKIKQIFDASKVNYDFVTTTKRGDGTPLATAAVQAGYDTIVAVGGDGLANEVLNGIGEKTTFGIIPCGEGNDFLKMFGQTFADVEANCQAIINGKTRKIDIGVINGRLFLNMIGIGFDGEVAERKAQTSKYLSGFYAYLVQIFPLLLTYKPKTVQIKMNGVQLKADILLLTIGNGRYSGGGFKLTPEAELDDGLFDVCLSKYPGRFTVLTSIAKVPKGEHTKLPFATMFRTATIDISSDQPLAAHVDGEILKECCYQIKILPLRLNIIIK